MVCPRCGAQETSDALFCRKCGTRLKTGYTGPIRAETPVRQSPPYVVEPEEDEEPERRSWKIPIIVGVVVLLAVVVFLVVRPGKKDVEPSERNEQIVEKVVSGQPPDAPLPEDDTETANGAADAAPEETGSTLLYRGVPVETIMEMQADELIAAFGEPDYQEEYFYEYKNRFMVSFDDMGRISSFSGPNEEFESDGKNLNQNQAGLTEAFGREPDYQEAYFMPELNMAELRWYDTSFSVNIRINDDGMSSDVVIWRKQTVEEAETLLRGLLADFGQSEILHPDYVSEGFLPSDGLQVYNFNLMDSDGLFLPVAVETDSSMIWAVPDDGETVPLSGYLTNLYGEDAPPS